MLHYAEMLRRHIMADSKIQQLCQSIYRKHQKALDLIYEHRPDRQAELRDYLCELIETNPNLVLDHASKTYIHFVPKAWDIPRLREGKGWTRSGRMLVFEFFNGEDRLRLTLIIGPGPDETRQRLFDMAFRHAPPFRRSSKTLTPMYSTIFNRSFLTPTAYQEKNIDELKEELDRQWKNFLEHDLPKLDAVLQRETWLWDKNNL